MQGTDENRLFFVLSMLYIHEEQQSVTMVIIIRAVVIIIVITQLKTWKFLPGVT